MQNVMTATLVRTIGARIQPTQILCVITTTRPWGHGVGSVNIVFQVLVSTGQTISISTIVVQDARDVLMARARMTMKRAPAQMRNAIV
jgi:hypothetical protein